ncbi:MAG: HAD-IB family phosphatase [Gemmatimonadota bacterium]
MGIRQSSRAIDSHPAPAFSNPGGFVVVQFILDFDSTFIQGEGLDELLAHTFRAVPQADVSLEARFRELTEAGMSGRLPFSQSLERRMVLLAAHRDQVAEVADALREVVTPSFVRDRGELSRRAREGTIHIVSGGFTELIRPVVADFGIPAERVWANDFIYDARERVVGVDQENPLSRDGGKVAVVQAMALPGLVVGVGDGSTDLELKRAGAVNRFIAFTENRRREAVVAGADAEATCLEEVWSWSERWI